MPGLTDPSEVAEPVVNQPAVRVRVIVTGRVQGVWFRDGCREQARAVGVAGFARNCSDGSVEVQVEGPEAAVERVVAWCRVGPARARVDSVAVERVEPVGETGFRIR